MDRNKQSLVSLCLLVVVFAAFYVANISGWLMHDDEGTDFYEIWQLQRGRQPGLDFIAEQQPLFLLAGRTVLDIAGRSVLGLRLLAAMQVLLGAMVLSLAVRRIWGGLAAILTLGLTLGNGMIYALARLFRPDPMMLAWEMAGLGLALLTARERKHRLWILAGIFYGVGFLWKPFGALPVVGLSLFFLDRLWRERARWRNVIVSGLHFAAPFLLVGVGVSVLLYSKLGFYYLEPFKQHLSLGQANTFLDQLGKTGFAYLSLLLMNIVFLFILPLWRLNAPKGWRQRPEIRLLLWQLLSPVLFVGMTRPIFARYFAYLIPVLAILLAWQVQLACRVLGRQRSSFGRWVPVVAVLVVGIALATTRPNLLQLLVRQESDTLRLADFVAAQTRPQDKVLSDYAGINFFAERDSIYEASIIAGGRIKGQVISGKLLIDRIAAGNVKMVLLHVTGGEPPPHQLINLFDFDAFQAYLTAHFKLLTVFDRAGQQIEIYYRP